MGERLFSTDMKTALAQKVQDLYQDLYPKNREGAFARRSQDTWERVTSELNAEYGSNLKKEQVKQKYENMKKEAKRKQANERK